MKTRAEDQTPRTEQESPQPYETPRLIRHGKVEDITQKVGAGSADGITGSGIL
jgi:hypothetical protein